MAFPQLTVRGIRELASRPEPTPPSEEWVVGLSLPEAEQLLDQLEHQGQKALAVAFDEKTGFAIRCR
jgi:hypothetical protein